MFPIAGSNFVAGTTTERIDGDNFDGSLYLAKIGLRLISVPAGKCVVPNFIYVGLSSR
jgi:hypothetical protein